MVDLSRVMACSPWFAQQWQTLGADEQTQLCAHIEQPQLAEDWQRVVNEAVAQLPPSSERALPELARLACPAWQKALRLLRRHQQMRLIARDLLGLSTMAELTRELSDFADAVMAVALHCAESELTRLHGQPIGDYSQAVQRMVVIGMGKLGGQELNLSSDIDLMFTYAEGGETNGSRCISNQEFFIKVGQRFIQYLDAVTADGFVFRVDMRLRPWGDGSALAASFEALESYYERHGREWERYALIKARICAGDVAQGEQLLKSLKPFVYRRYIDFGAFESLREMKAMIAREVAKLDREDNIKLGSGGIREVEFIAQAFQLIRGGVDTVLQERGLLNVLAILAAQELLPASSVAQLVEAYVFLRNAEHRIQAQHDQQTQTLPQDPDDQQRLAEAMHCVDYQRFLQTLNQHRDIVHHTFQDVIVARDADVADEPPPPEWPPAIQQLLDSRAAQQMGQTSQQRLHRLLPMLVQKCAQLPDAELAYARVLPLIEATLRRSAYLMLLIENPGALGRLLELCCASPWIAEALARHPVLLDELLNTSTLYAPPTREVLDAELHDQLMRIPEDDLERQMDVLRIFQKSQVLRVAASDLTGTLPLMKISDALTWVAEAVLEQVLLICWRQLVSVHGRPCRADGTPCEPGFIVVGYGKLGGIELGYGSDLDLVFVHDGDPERETDGGKPMDVTSFYARLGQKMIHMLTTAMSTGALYEVDMRLRPSGASGLLVSSLSGFASYQLDSAWTWEHQALVRARVVAGDVDLARRFDEVRAHILQRPRERAVLRAEVLAMRQKMRDHLAPKSDGLIDIKHSPGGLVDIEFLVQFLTLAHAHDTPALSQWTDNVRLLETLAAHGHLPPDEADVLRASYLTLRAAGHRIALAKGGGIVEQSSYQQERVAVMQLWQKYMAVTA